MAASSVRFGARCYLLAQAARESRRSSVGTYDLLRLQLIAEPIFDVRLGAGGHIHITRLKATLPSSRFGLVEGVVGLLVVGVRVEDFQQARVTASRRLSLVREHDRAGPG